ncbi:glycosyltransferase family 2 protein [Nitrospirillum sp. BR 11828]|uniref:glycosyltransferase family 2 protein n=1 Tax=Nitrospirillum sp. BR 11828 TaxID=3104325 RepID=UPI002ACA931C|nr:glycosyltransferase family 2 protein [Nitrospirillum sp. BR 11828]MDZ5650604.1 glycosyltransferase family 2 protein [Nitrospirillum sp. BR 11828]
MAITMAGFGSRFAKAGYTVPKYQIEVFGRPLFDWSMLALTAFRDAGWRFAFAVRADDRARDFITERCKILGIDIAHFADLPAPTDGQATTARILAAAAEDRQQPFAIFNIDTFVRPGAMTPDEVPADCDGWVPCFPGPGEGWSFVRLGDDGKAVELREKQRISPHATVGFYWFGSVALYIDAYDRFFAHGGEEKGERYVAPLYNQLIADGRTVRISNLSLDDVGQLGTPDQVTLFEKSPPAGAKVYI